MLSALGELRQEDSKLKANLDTLVYIMRPCLKEKKRENLSPSSHTITGACLFCFDLVSFSEMGFCTVAQAPLTFYVFLLAPPNCWDSWCETPKLANSLNDFWDPGPVRANLFRRGAFGEVTCS